MSTVTALSLSEDTMPKTTPLTSAQVREIGTQLAQLLADAGALSDTETTQEALPAVLRTAFPAFLRKVGISVVDHNHTRLPFGRLVPEGQCPRCDERRAEQAEGIPARPAPAWTGRAQRSQEATNGYPTRAEHDEHFRPGGPHQRGTCGPICTFGDY
jgi:hypothetical protein